MLAFSNTAPLPILCGKHARINEGVLGSMDELFSPASLLFLSEALR